MADSQPTALFVVEGDGQVGGMLAGVGQRMLPGVAKMLMNQFFECLMAKLTSQVA